MALEGNLEDFRLEEVVQSIALSKKSGKLEIHGKMGIYGIFFKDGTVIHAFGPYSIGKDAIKDIFLESEGTFSFKQNLILPPKTFNENIFSVITDGISLRDELKETVAKLSKTGKITAVTDTGNAEVEITEMEWRVLRMVIENKSIGEIIEVTGLSFIEFVRVIKSLVSKNMIQL